MIDSDFVAYFQIDLIQELFANAKEDYGHPEDQIADILPGLSPIPFKDLPHEIILKNQSNPDPVVPLLSSRVKKLPQASAVLLNSYEELNPTLLTTYLKSNLQNVLYVGSLTQSPPAFGADATVAELDSEELKELAEALEVSEVPFLCSLKDHLKDYLPDGFAERTREHGKVVP
ncbi:hypothetical protein P3X46_013159 [Hevea brasiliensis]|uniref:Uncharacterized protein n=1 Tax=Hevea brasiliensis TaxID=3981 RepID=A0ABQ9M4G2_HEVBR|nr:hypothetical protein P3X46_013159 [Hevea brasiliensis]